MEMMRESRQVFGGERLGTVSVGGSVRKQHTTSREELKAKYGHLENPPGSIGLRKPGSITGTYPKEEKVRLLCSVLSPKPRSDFKNRMLTPTILTRRCHLNNLKPDSYLLSIAPLRGSPCFLCWLHLPSTA